LKNPDDNGNPTPASKHYHKSEKSSFSPDATNQKEQYDLKYEMYFFVITIEDHRLHSAAVTGADTSFLSFGYLASCDP
jgi:hypothetical protein